MLQWLSKESFYFMPIDHSNIQLALALRLVQFETESNLKCSLALLTEAFDKILWKHQRPSSLSDAIDAIFSTSNKDLIVSMQQLEEPQITAILRKYSV